MDQGKKKIDKGRGGEESMDDPKQTPEPPAGLIDRFEDQVVDAGEKQSEEEVKDIAESAGAGTVSGEHGAQQEGQIDPRHPQLRGCPQSRRQNQGSEEATRERALERDHQRVPRCSVTAALIKARWTSPWGKLPRKAPLAGSISSE